MSAFGRKLPHRCLLMELSKCLVIIFRVIGKALLNGSLFEYSQCWPMHCGAPVSSDYPSALAFWMIYDQSFRGGFSGACAPKHGAF